MEKEINEIKRAQTVREKLQKVRLELSKKELKKSGINKISNSVQFKYFELSDFLPTAIELFDKYGLTPEFSIVTKDNGIEVATLDIWDCSDKVHFEVPTAEANGYNPIQQQGSKITYMRRYLYLIALDIVENDIVDAQDQKEVAKTKVDYASKFQIQQITQYGKLIANELSEKNIKTPNQIKALTLEEADKLVKLINERLVQNGKEEK